MVFPRIIVREVDDGRCFFWQFFLSGQKKPTGVTLLADVVSVPKLGNVRKQLIKMDRT